MKKIISLAILWLLAVCIFAEAQTMKINNPVIGGFSPDPSVCRAGDYYYLCNSSFTWYPGLPIYRSRDLVSWELIGHGIERPDMVSLDGLMDKDGVWAPTIRWHDGVFYIFCNVSNGGNFFITARDAAGPWSNPVYIKDEEGNPMPGIDPSVFWDEDGTSYVLGNIYDFPGRRYDSSTAIWIQRIDLTTGILEGERHILASGHAFNAKFAEGAHLYKIEGRYVLLVAEGGTDFYHAETALASDSIFGPYLAQTNNPVLSNRQLGHNAPVQCVGHADLVQTGDGDWYAVALGKRMIPGQNTEKLYAFTRETFLCPVSIEEGELFFNPGYGYIALSDDPSSQSYIPDKWYYERIPKRKFDSWNDGALSLELLPESIDSLVSPALLLRKVSPLGFKSQVKIAFSAQNDNEAAGLVLHRNNGAYLALLKTKNSLLEVSCSGGVKDTLATVPWDYGEVAVGLEVNGTEAVFSYGRDKGDMRRLAETSIVNLADSKPLNRFNGVGIGLYASSNGQESSSKADFSAFTLENY